MPRLACLVLALVLAGCGRPEHDVPYGSDVPDRQATPRETERETRLLTLVNRSRREKGLNELALDERLSTIARAHSQDLADGRYVAHDSPIKGDLAERLHRAGFAVERAGENVGRTRTVEEAHQGFLDSEDHRDNVYMFGAEHLGVGVVERDGWLYTTEIFVRTVADDPPADVRASLWERAGTTGRDDVLDRVADRLAPEIPVALAAPDLDALGRRCVEELRLEGLDRFDFELVALVSSRPATADVAPIREASAAGIGVARGVDDEGRPIYKILFLVAR